MNEIFISEEIGKGPGQFSLADLEYALRRANPQTELVLQINCEGGQLFESLAIHDRIARWAGVTRAVITGIAASGATLIACACDVVQISPNAVYFIHSPQFDDTTQPSPQQRATVANEAEKMLAIYHRRTGKPVDRLRSLLRAETLLNASQAIDWGFVDELTATKYQAPAAPALTARATRSATSIWQEAFRYELGKLAATGRRVTDIRAAAMLAVDAEFPGLRSRMIQERNRA